MRKVGKSAETKVFYSMNKTPAGGIKYINVQNHIRPPHHETGSAAVNQYLTDF